jgi:hypothetical protein
MKSIYYKKILTSKYLLSINSNEKVALIIHVKILLHNKIEKYLLQKILTSKYLLSINSNEKVAYFTCVTKTNRIHKNNKNHIFIIFDIKRLQ